MSSGMVRKVRKGNQESSVSFPGISAPNVLAPSNNQMPYNMEGTKRPLHALAKRFFALALLMMVVISYFDIAFKHASYKLLQKQEQQTAALQSQGLRGFSDSTLMFETKVLIQRAVVMTKDAKKAAAAQEAAKNAASSEEAVKRLVDAKEKKAAVVKEPGVAKETANKAIPAAAAARGRRHRTTQRATAVVPGAAEDVSGPSTSKELCGHLAQAPQFLHETTSKHIDEHLQSLWQKLEKGTALNGNVLSSGWTKGDYTRMDAFAQKLQKKQELRIEFWGGSFVMGAGCKESALDIDYDPDCPWPARVRRWWEHAFPSNPAVWVNRATHGINSRELLNSLGTYALGMTAHPDLVIIDCTVNDAEIQENTDIIYEALIRAFLAALPRTQLFLVEDGCPACLKIAPQRRKIAQHYHIPTLDYAALTMKYNKCSSGCQLWPFTDPELKGPFTVPGTTWPDWNLWSLKVTQTTCCPSNHPPWIVHQYYADAFVHGIRQVLQNFCVTDEDYTKSEDKQLSLRLSKLPSPLAPQKVLDQYAMCVTPLSYYDSRHPVRNASAPSVLDGDWRLFEDRPGRPGWIATKLGSKIMFPVRLGADASLTISYLRSYENVGDAKVSVYRAGRRVGDPDHPVLLKGLWEKRFSLPDTEVFYNHVGLLNLAMTREEEQAMRQSFTMHGLKSSLDYELEIELVAGKKFKVLSVTSC